MFWADQVAEELKKRKLPLEWVDDMKTPSGRIHVGALRGVVIHNLIYKALKNAGVKAKYTYIFDDHDPMDDLPVYLSREKFEKYLGVPLFKIPSPDGKAQNYAQYFAQEFQTVFNQIDCHPEIIWASELYLSGKMNEVIKECLDKADIIRGIYEELYKKPLAKTWFPFKVFCPNCGKVSTTQVFDWDGKKVAFSCEVEAVPWTKGCGRKGETSPFSDKEELRGKLLWKVEWACKWKVLGVTVEGAGKDHMSRGGSHDLASLVSKRVLNYPVPYPVAYEWFLVGGKKMSTSRGVGTSAKEILEILPPEVLRFLMVRTRINQAINFDPTDSPTIPKLFDDYDRENPSELKRFKDIVNLLQMPGREKELEREGVKPRVPYVKIWLERFAPEEQKFTIKEEFPEEALHLSGLQKMFLARVSDELAKKWEPEEFEKELYRIEKELELSSKDAFSAVYLSLLGKNHGPKAAQLILSLDKKFVINRFREAAR